jgi:hypothetical protein
MSAVEEGGDQQETETGDGRENRCAGACHGRTAPQLVLFLLIGGAKDEV